MKKTDLVTAMAQSSNITKAASEKALAAILDAIGESLARGENVTLVGFGTFSVSNRAARVGRNPKTGKELKIAATKVVKFKSGQKLSDAVK